LDNNEFRSHKPSLEKNEKTIVRVKISPSKNGNGELAVSSVDSRFRKVLQSLILPKFNVKQKGMSIHL
jgi:hypothetical protein